MSNTMWSEPSASRPRPTSSAVDDSSTILTLEENGFVASTSKMSLAREQPCTNGIDKHNQPSGSVADQAAALVDQECQIVDEVDVQGVQGFIASRSTRSPSGAELCPYNTDEPNQPSGSVADQAAAMVEKECQIVDEVDAQAEFLKYFNLVRVKKVQWRKKKSALLRIMDVSEASRQVPPRSVVLVGEDRLLVESIPMDSDEVKAPLALLPVELE